jgi:hypothetical protein
MSSYNNARRWIDNRLSLKVVTVSMTVVPSCCLICVRYNVEDRPMSVRFNFSLS